MAMRLRLIAAQCSEGRGLVEENDSSDISSVPHVGIPLVNLIQSVGLGDQVVELQDAITVEIQEARNVVSWIGRPKD